MDEVPMVPDRDIDRDWNDLIQVTGLAVARAKCGKPVFYLEVEAFHSGQPAGRRLSLALSPPAAAQLSRSLRKEVKAYLRGERDPETE